MNPGDATLKSILQRRIAEGGGWLRFDDFMRVALYEPGLGYYSGPARKFGRQAGDGSDFVTAPELSPLFGRTLARQVGQILALSSSSAVLEFGAGSGRLAADVLLALGDACTRYSIVELSAGLREVQQATLERLAPAHAYKVTWLDAWPVTFSGCVIGNELLDAMPVRLVERGVKGWLERGVICVEDVDDMPATTDASANANANANANAGSDVHFAFATLPADPALQALVAERIEFADAFPSGYRTEIAEEAPAFVATLADVLAVGAAIFIDYGFPQAEYYHPQRNGGTLMCHQGHLSDTDPLVHVGMKDITAHVDFTAVALAGQDAGMDVAGYTSQARFLINAGLLDLLADAGQDAGQGADFRIRASAQTLITEHEMGELFKVVAFTKGLGQGAASLIGFTAGDRSHTL